MQMTNAAGREQLLVMLICLLKVALCGRVESADGTSSGTKDRRAAQGHFPTLRSPPTAGIRRTMFVGEIEARLSLETVGLCVPLSVIMEMNA